MKQLTASLRHYWRLNLAVLAGAAVATAVLTGALLVGDSVRGSLRSLTLERLGDIDGALVLNRFVRTSLADDLEGATALEIKSSAPAIFATGTARQPDSGRRASKVNLLGIEESFADMYPNDDDVDFSRAEGQLFPSVWLNQALARELAVEPGEEVLLQFGQYSEIPRDTLLGEKEADQQVGTLRLSVRGILPNRGMGRFALQPSQQTPLIAYVELRRMQRAMEQPGKVNAIFASGGADLATLDPIEIPGDKVRLEDMGLNALLADQHFVLESVEFVLRDPIAEAAIEVADSLGVHSMPLQGYLANSLTLGEKSVPYSLVVGLDPINTAPWNSLTRRDGTPAAPLDDEGLYLNAWTADQLDAKVGDAVVVTYYEVGAREELVERAQTLSVRGIVQMNDLGSDPDLTPEYPGVKDAEDMSAWDPPFPVDLDAVRPVDEEYWDDYGAAPKAFISPTLAKQLWQTRFGTTTGIRIGGQAGQSESQAIQDFRAAFLERITPGQMSLQFQPIKAQGLQAATGATDFAGLFLAFSFFLILSAALLVALLFGLGVEQRAREIGLLLAIGYPPAGIRRRLLGEGLLLALCGAVIGTLAGVGYAKGLMWALRTIWRSAVGSSSLYLHIQPVSLVIGALIAIFVVALAIFVSLRRLKKLTPPTLLSGRTQVVRQLEAGTGRVAGVVGAVGLLLGLGLSAMAWMKGGESSAPLAFGSAFGLLVAGIALFSRWARTRSGGTSLPGPVWGMAARNSSWNPGRSILSVALVASACFMIVAVGANRGQLGDELEERTSGSGGFGLVAESDTPLLQSLNRTEDRLELGFDEQGESLLAGATTLPFRMLPGDDASCLNLYKPEKPKILGVPQELVDRGGFSFKQTRADLSEAEKQNPWALLNVANEPGVIPAIADFNSAQWILKKKIGDRIPFEDEYGRTVELELVAMLNTSVFQSELLISEQAFLEHFPSRSGYRYFLIDSPALQREELETSVEKTLEAFGFDTSTTREKIESYKAVEHTYLSTFQTLGGLGLLLGTIGLAVVMMRSVLERRAELATLRAFGYRRPRLASMVLAENAFLLGVGMTIGTVAALVSVAPRLASIHVPWGQLAITLAVILAVGMAASLLAVRFALKVPLIPALKADR